MKTNLVLIGFMGTGKSSIGKYLAQKLGKTFIELDKEIMERAGKAITAIFAEDGEEAFRQLEAQLVEEWSLQDNLVISTGGGVVLKKENISNLRKKGLLICLEAEPEVIFKRIEKDTGRPLLAVDNPLEKIKELLAKRAPFYQVADYTLDTTNLSPEETGEHIIGFWEGWLYGKNAD